MNNAELFKKIFGIYAEEFWAYPKDEMLNWLVFDAPEDVVRRKKGKWIIDEKRFGNAEHHCNLCGAILEGDEWEWRNNYFCYHCGAQMEGEEDES